MDSEKVELLPCCKGLQIKQFYTGIEKKAGLECSFDSNSCETENKEKLHE